MHLQPQGNKRGYALLITMCLACVGALILAGVLDWASQNALLTTRNNEYFTTCYAAEAATEKVFANLSRDYQNYGEGVVYSRIPQYLTNPPSTTDSSYWADYEFNNGAGAVNRVTLQRVNPTNSILLGAPYAGLRSFGSTYQTIANAKNSSTRHHIPGAVGQEVHLGTIPIFQFAIFYQGDMEINPGPTMNITGLVHGNSDIYLQPQSALRFYDDISASGTIIPGKKPGDPLNRTSGTITYDEYHLSGVNPLNLPVGTNTTGVVTNIGDNVYGIIDLPDLSELPNSAVGTNRLYNKADLILILSNNLVVVKSGVSVDNSATVIPTNQWKLFLRTNDNFTNKRENINVQATTIDVEKLRLWSGTNTVLRPLLGNRDVSSIYVADLRPTSNAVLTTNFTVSTNYTLITNTTPTTSRTYPAADSYLGPVNNTTVSTNAPPPAPAAPPALNITPITTGTTDVVPPAPGTYTGTITTNTAATTTSSYPSAGTYTDSVTTNTVVTRSDTYPSPGTYFGPVVTNSTGKRYTYNLITGYSYARITGYSYNLITSYTYLLPAYAYNRITSVGTNTSRATNLFYNTNFTVFAQSGIVLTNGRTLPALGLTVVTPDPLYITGDYNTSLDGISFYTGSADTSHARPAAIMADAIMVLSTAWNPVNSSGLLSARIAASTTVNAAFLSGIVPTGDGYYSGGVENFPRFLEDWSSRTFTYNGSMVVMFDSRVATAPWLGTGSTYGVYNPPIRSWAFDTNFLDPRKLPPLTPQVISVTRGRWSLISPNTTTF